jgi:peroxiredoxin
LRSEHAKLTSQGAALIGIVAQDTDDTAAFLARNPLPFPLLSDTHRSVMQAYDVYNALSYDAFRIAHPSAFIIDPSGIIRYSYVAANQMDWPRTDLLASELVRLKQETQPSSGV